MKILIFSGFVVVYLLYLAGTVYLMNKIMKDVRKMNFLKEVLITIITTTFLFGFIFIIGQFFNLKLLLITMVALSLGTIFSYAVWALIGSPRVPFRSIGAWAGANIGFEYPITVKVYQLIATVIIVIYPIAIGIIFFDSSYSLEDTRILAFKFTIILALSNFLVSSPLSFGILTTGYIDEDTRARYVTVMITSIIPLAIYISLFFWLYNIDKEGASLFSIGEISFVYSPIITLILMAFLLLFIVLPYAIGHNRSKRLSNDYLSSSKRLLKKITDAFELSSIDNISNKITESRAIIAGRFEKLQEDNIGVAMAMDMSINAIVNTDFQTIKEWYIAAEPYDKRFVFYHWLDNIYRKLGEFDEELNDQKTDKKKQEILKKFTAYFQSKYKELTEEGKAEKSNHKLWIGLFAILSPILGAVISEIGNLIVNFFKGLI